MRIKSRFFLVALLVASQAACLSFGVIWATGWLWGTFEQVVHNHVIAEGQAQTQKLAILISEMHLDSIEPGSIDWWKLQGLCEETEIAHKGFACVMRDDNGAMLCHPQLDGNPSLLELFPGRKILVDGKTSAPIIERMEDARSSGTQLISGEIELNEKLHVLTGIHLPALGAVLAVYQSDNAIEQFITATIQPVMQVGYILTAFIVGATAILTVFLINRYEIGLAEANARLEKQVQDRTRSLLKTRNAVIFGLAKLAESRDRDTGEHLERIRSYVTILATELAKTDPAIDHRFVADLAVASSLHDIGKVGIPDAVLLKPAKLTSAERRAMQLHTVLGSECLAAIQRELDEDDFLELAQQIAIAHHEHWNGNGYPYGIQGMDIPLAARIVALADCYDALTTRRPYKKSFSHADSREWIVTRYGTHFDPAVVEAFIAREQDFIRVKESYSHVTEEDYPDAPGEIEEQLNISSKEETATPESEARA